MPSEKDGVMIILSSPSGAGKTTLVKKLSEKDNFEIRQPETLPYSIFGAVPQVDGKHDLNGKNLVPIDEY